MAIGVSSSAAEIWDEIQVSENYLVSGMCDEAASVSSSVLKDLRCKRRQIEETEQINDMLESAGMVLVQTLKELGRTENIIKELLQVFGSITAIPIQVFLTGVSFQLSKGTCQDTRIQVEEFLSKWKFVDDQYYYFPAETAGEVNKPLNEGGCVVGVEEYLEVVEIYIVTLVGSVAMEKDIDTAVSWVEKLASLPEDKRQDLLRRLQSLCSHNVPEPSQGSLHLSIDESPESRSQYLKESPDGLEETLVAPCAPNRENNTKQSISKLSQQRVGGCIWWFRSITFNLGNRQVAISNGKLVLGCFIVLVYYIMKKKRASLKEHLKRRILSVRKVLVDLWELAFSYQVNPLAAVQPIPIAPRGSR